MPLMTCVSKKIGVIPGEKKIARKREKGQEECPKRHFS